MNEFVQACNTQALLARNLCPPNPAVGAILVNDQGEVVGVGHTQRRGGAHAEIMALRDAAARGNDVRGSTAYVSLEPCSHHGRTGPCADALIQAGVRRVVSALEDPNPLVAGRGFQKLRAAGVEVEVGPGADASRELNIGFFSRMVRGTPWVRMKIAASLDGRTALDNGSSQWLTSEAARADGHAWRARACAVLTGIGTVLADNPRLDVRLVESQRQPRLVVLDSQLRTPPDARLFEAEREVLIYTASDDSARKAALENRGATVLHLPGPAGAGAQVDLRALLADLAVREVNELHVEAGHRLNGALVQAGLVDECLVYLAPKLVGPGLPMASFGPLAALSEAVPLDFMSSQQVGVDLRVVARVRGHDRF